jgi:hypothetical protein
VVGFSCQWRVKWRSIGHVLGRRAQFWSRLGIDVLLDERKPRKRVLVSQQLLCLAAVGGAVVGATAGVIVGLATAARKRNAENAAQRRPVAPRRRNSLQALLVLGRDQNALESNRNV